MPSITIADSVRQVWLFMLLHHKMNQQEISLQTIWEAIHKSKDEMTALINAKTTEINTTLNKVQVSLSSLSDQIAELEQRVSGNEDNVDDITKRLLVLEKDNAYLRDKADEAENRSRSNNLRFVNVPERSEGTDMIGFIVQLISLLLGSDNFATPPVIERAHRTPAFNTNTKAKSSRSILAKFLHFQDKIKILRLAREKKELVYMGTRIHIYPDYSAELLKKRRQFDSIKKKLRESDTKYSLLYPSTLRVVVDGKPKLFHSHEEANDFFRDLLSSP